jgi:diguanylate cyclase (GGDEF)-like protein/PAS domain S-box-containing protein
VDFQSSGADPIAEEHESASWEAVSPIYFFKELVETATDCVLILDCAWRITYLNGPAEVELCQHGPVVNLTLWEAFPEGRGSEFDQQFSRAMHDRVRVAFETYCTPLQSWIEIKATPLSSGGLGIWFSNVTGRKKAQLAMAALEERYRLTAKATNDLLRDWDLATNTIVWNEAIDERFGYSVQKLGTDSKWWLDRIHPDDRGRVQAELGAYFDGSGKRFASEYRFLRGDGSYAEVFDRGYVIRGLDGAPIRMVGALQDITERNSTVRQNRQKQAQLETVFGQAMVGILQVSLKGELLMANQRFCEILDRSVDQMRQSTLADYTHPEDIEWNFPLFEKASKSGEPYQVEKRYVRPDGSFVWCETNVSFVRDQDGNVESCIVVAQDISARKAAEDALSNQSALLQNVIDSVADLIFVKDRTGRFILTNRALDEGCGELVGLRTTDHFEEELTAGYEALDQEVISSGEARSSEEVIPIRREPRQFQTIKVPWIQNGHISGVIGVSRDITELKQSEMALRESELLYRSILEGCPDAIVIMDRTGKIELMNAAALAAAGSDLGKLRGLAWASLWRECTQPVIRAAIDEAANGAVSRFTVNGANLKGKMQWWDVLVAPIRDDAGQVIRLFGTARDITNQRETSNQLKWASEHDALTKLPNRRAFQARLQAATISAMASGKEIGLLLLDLDHFKHVNDTLGHAAGDHLLAVVGSRLTKSMRGEDFVARLGGDEFAVILTDIDDQEGLIRAADSILSRLNKPIRLNGRLMSAGASLGGALFPADAKNAHELFNNADIALYAMKESGRGGTKMFHQHMREQAHAAANQLSLARVAITEKSVVPHYQQKVDLKTGAIVGFEALLRWNHPERGIQLPDTVGEAFKDYELASKIGELMQRAVFQDMRTWQARNQPIGSVSINAAPSEFLRDDFAERLISRLEEFQVPFHLVEIEVTEHVFLERGSEFVARALQCLNRAGVRIALDDFGTGYSSLSHLRDFPVDVVKIDQSFVRKMVDETDIGAIVSAVISLARNLKIEVVAEGVETQQQLEFLQNQRCAVGQGYLFGRAVVADDLPNFLNNIKKKRVGSFSKFAA